MKVTKFTGYNPASVDAILSVGSTTFVSAASNALDSSAIGGVTPVNSAQSNWHLVAYSSNFAEWRPDDGGSASVSFGSNSTDVGGLTLPGGGSDSARSTHYHAGIFSVTASSSNTLQRPTLNLRPGSNVVFGLTDTDGSGALDTLTINNSPPSQFASIVVSIGGTGSTITTGVKGDIRVPFDCTIVRASLLADQTGSVVVDIWGDGYANYPPVVGDSITASAKPTISSAIKSEDTTLTGWRLGLGEGSTLRYNVDSCTTITRVSVELRVRKT